MEDATLNIVPYNNTYDKENFNYKDSFYVNFIDVQINCVGKLMGAHKFILANRSDYFKEILTKNPKIHQIEMAIPSKIVDRVFSLIYGQSITIKESELGDLARVCIMLKVNFSVLHSDDSPKGTTSSSMQTTECADVGAGSEEASAQLPEPMD